jgi:site-specific DNA-methyltransferase (adenine-specific)
MPEIHHGDCIEVMRTLPDNSVDSIVTDPPYGLGFMGKAWDALPPGEDWARECLRVLKPGGHLLAFGGTRTWHRLAVAVEDAGFEIRDSIAWLYGEGMPKSLDVSKAIDKLDAAAERLERARIFQSWLRQHLTPQLVNAVTGTVMGHHLTTHPTQPSVATADIFDLLRPILPPVPDYIEELVRLRTVESANFKARKVTGTRTMVDTSTSRMGFVGKTYGGTGATREVNDTAAHTPEAELWQGWGTALKPAFEPAVVARKPLAGTVAATVIEFGTGAVNIDATRHGERWPANVILDESQAEALAESKYFYVAKPSKAERPVVDGIAHPTVKPLALMRWLVKLVTPPGGTVLEPFAGSGATVEACILEGFRCIAIEREAEYLPLIQARIDRAA